MARKRTRRSFSLVARLIEVVASLWWSGSIAALAYALVAQPTQFSWLDVVYWGVIPAAGLSFVGGFWQEFNKRLKHWVHTKADVAAARRGEEFALYLRPFETDAALHDKTSLMAAILGPHRLEELALRACEVEGIRLVAVGEDALKSGAAKLTATNETWREEVLSLIAKASLIFIVPGPNEGTLWELDQLVSRYKSKTVILMPSQDFFGSGQGEAYWTRTQQAVATACDVVLPPFNPRGGVFFLAFGVNAKSTSLGLDYGEICNAIETCLRMKDELREVLAELDPSFGYMEDRPSKQRQPRA